MPAKVGSNIYKPSHFIHLSPCGIAYMHDVEVEDSWYAWHGGRQGAGGAARRGRGRGWGKCVTGSGALAQLSAAVGASVKIRCVLPPPFPRRECCRPAGAGVRRGAAECGVVRRGLRQGASGAWGAFGVRRGGGGEDGVRRVRCRPMVKVHEDDDEEEAAGAYSSAYSGGASGAGASGASGASGGDSSEDEGDDAPGASGGGGRAGDSAASSASASASSSSTSSSASGGAIALKFRAAAGRCAGRRFSPPPLPPPLPAPLLHHHHHHHHHWAFHAGVPATFHIGPGFEPQQRHGRPASPPPQPPQPPAQHVVHFHVNPGVTVSFQMGEHVQVIKGDATADRLVEETQRGGNANDTWRQ
ncbi:Uncharacterized protein GBIM_10642 [Gryllus bimaculatus]|nr:Uncharacterized protein GBIM_10642 [Gryllus bimaculatus]